jgi:hypothetical protein
MTGQGVTGSLNHKLNSHLIGFEIMFPYERGKRQGTYRINAPTRLHCHNSYHNQQYFEVFDFLGCYAASLCSLLVPYLNYVLAEA